MISPSRGVLTIEEAFPFSRDHPAYVSHEGARIPCLSPPAHPSSLVAPTPRFPSQGYEWFQGDNPVGTGLGDNHQLWSVPCQYVRLTQYYPRDRISTSKSTTQRAGAVKSDQPAGNFRPLIANPLSQQIQLCPIRPSLRTFIPSFKPPAMVSPRFCSEIGCAICGWSLDSPRS